MSVYNPQIPQSFLEQLEVMSTDIRAQKKAIADALAVGQAAQGTANTAQSAAEAAASALQVVSGTVTTLSAEMVRKFKSEPIAAASFVLDAVSGYFYATVSHMLGDATPDIEVFDNDGDKQAVQSILVNNDTIKLELSAAEMASNSFPLTCICLGKNTPVPGVGSNGIQLPGGTDLIRYNSAINGGTIEYSLNGGDNWAVIDNAATIAQSYLASDGVIFNASGDGVTFTKVIPGQWLLLPTDGGRFAQIAADPSSVLLGVYQGS
jgi:hypothetical protein